MSVKKSSRGSVKEQKKGKIQREFLFLLLLFYFTLPAYVILEVMPGISARIYYTP